MNAKAIVLIAAFIASGNVFAERMGRDSVYPKAGPSTTVPAKFPAFAGNGRGSVYASSDRSVGTPLKGAPVTYSVGPKQYLAVQSSGRHLHPVKFDKLENSSYLFVFALN